MLLLSSQHLAQVTFTVSTAGLHDLSVLANGRPVRGSPFRIEVQPGRVVPGSCRLYGPGLAAVRLGRDMRIFVQLADAFGNVVTEPGRLEGSKVKVTHRAHIQGFVCM
jgi:hypothetical protein